MQRSALFNDTQMLDAPAEDRRRTSYGSFYDTKKAQVASGRRAGIASNKNACSNRCY